MGLRRGARGLAALTLCGAATGVNADDQEHAAEQLTARLREGAGDKLLQGIELVLDPATVNADGVQLDISSPGPTGPGALSISAY
ncbi:hypothetical protein [Amycolatopsis tolypomycina]|uniref:hypothetical protein n=1 Tax=Amycolatopsis tolypomycina TaxID=208445 RepID=UPI0033ADF60D